MVVVRVIVYTGVAISLSVYAYRAYRRWIAPHVGSDPSPAGRTGGGPASPDATTTVEPPKGRRGLGFTDPRRIGSDDAPGESLVQAVIREEVAKQRGLAPSPGSTGPGPPDGGSGRTGLFAPAPAPAGDRAERVSVAAALTGVRLPDDLVPLVDPSGAMDPHHVLFTAAETPAPEIGRHLGDELERLGYTLRSESERAAVATKGAVELRITLYPDAGNERLDGRARFPTAAPGSVVVELET